MVAAKKLREDVADKVSRRVTCLKSATQEPFPNERNLTAKINELKEMIPAFEDAHNRYILGEENDDLKKTAEEEYHTIMDSADAVLYPAESQRDLLSAAASVTVPKAFY